MQPTMLEQRQEVDIGPVQNGFSETIALRGVTKVLIGGFDNAGKSTLACSLYKSINEHGVQSSLYELDRWSDTHDAILGKKRWDERNKRPEVTHDEYARYAEGFKNDEAAIVIGDLEGRFQNEHIRTLKGAADFGLLVSRDPIPKDAESNWVQTESGWRSLFEELEVPIAAHIRSILPGQKHPPGTLPIQGLERELVPQHRGVQLLAKTIIYHAELLQK